jgi:hypothetical protein
LRAAPGPSLLPGEFCGPCPLACAERDTAASCSHSSAAGRTVDVRNPGLFEQWLNWSDRAFVPKARVEPPDMPPYMPVLTRGVPASAVRALTVGTVAFTWRDFRALAHTAERRRVDVRALIGSGERRVVVLGADPDRVCVRSWQEWREVRGLLVRHRPDLVVGPDLGFYELDEPATRIIHHFAHTRMYASLIDDGVAALPPIGWVFPSDIDRFVEWVEAANVRGAFLDLQHRTRDSSFERALNDLRGFRRRLPPDFLWIVKGTQVVARWSALREVLGSVTVTSSGPWQEATNHKVFEPYTLERVATDLEPEIAFVESVGALAITAESLGRPRRPRTLPEQLRIGIVPETRGAVRA